MLTLRLLLRVVISKRACKALLLIIAVTIVSITAGISGKVPVAELLRSVIVLLDGATGTQP